MAEQYADYVQLVASTPDALHLLADNKMVSATTSETGIKMAIATGKVYDFRAVITNAPYTGYVAGTAEWTATIEASDAVAGTYKLVSGSVPLDGKGGQAQILLTGLNIARIVPNASYLRVTATKIGTPGNAIYSAYLVPTRC
jgi:hypothetical protein